MRSSGPLHAKTWILKGICSVENDAGLALVHLSSLEHLSLVFRKLAGRLSCSHQVYRLSTSQFGPIWDRGKHLAHYIDERTEACLH